MAKINDDYAALGLQALRRAAQKVAENARKDGSKIPIWRKPNKSLQWTADQLRLLLAGRRPLSSEVEWSYNNEAKVEK